MSIKNTNFKHNINTSNIKWTTKNISYKRAQGNCKTWWKKSLQPFLFCNVMKRRPQGTTCCGKRQLQRHKGHNIQEFSMGTFSLLKYFLFVLTWGSYISLKRYPVFRLCRLSSTKGHVQWYSGLLKAELMNVFELTVGQMTTRNVRGLNHSANPQKIITRLCSPLRYTDCVSIF